jgi:hypothetical protein
MIVLNYIEGFKKEACAMLNRFSTDHFIQRQNVVDEDVRDVLGFIPSEILDHTRCIGRA